MRVPSIPCRAALLGAGHRLWERVHHMAVDSLAAAVAAAPDDLALGRRYVAALHLWAAAVTARRGSDHPTLAGAYIEAADATGALRSRGVALEPGEAALRKEGRRLRTLYTTRIRYP